MRLMSIVTASVMIGATTGLSSAQALAQNYVAGSTSSVGTFTWTYEPGSNRKSSLAYPNGATASWSYNNRGELTSVQNRHADGTAISTYDYTYDAAGRRISKNDERYGYNARSELTQATSISDPNFHAAYRFDDIGNRETSAEFGIRSGEYTYTANELNQYASIDPSSYCCVSGSLYSVTGEIAATIWMEYTGDCQGGFNRRNAHYWLEWGDGERVDANAPNDSQGKVVYYPHTKKSDEFDLYSFDVYDPPIKVRNIVISRCKGEDVSKFLKCLTRRAALDQGIKSGKLCHEYVNDLEEVCREESK